MFASADPEWLYSTTAQSSAALVAIIGGFLVSRMVAVATERQGLKRREEHLLSRLSWLEILIVELEPSDSSGAGIHTLPSEQDSMTADEWRRLYDNSANEQLGVEQELRITREQIDLLKNPPEVAYAWIALSALTATGVVLPVAMLTIRPVPSGAGARALLLGAFVAGLVALMGYIWWAVRRLNK